MQSLEEKLLIAVPSVHNDLLMVGIIGMEISLKYWTASSTAFHFCNWINTSLDLYRLITI
jgi:hypothetical protein